MCLILLLCVLLSSNFIIVISQVEYAKYIGPKVLKFYEDYFDIKFPLPKVDMIAIPDFSAGAMENWVAIKRSII